MEAPNYRNLKFASILDLNLGEGRRPKNESVWRVGEAFIANMQRAYSHILLPMKLMSFCTIQGLAAGITADEQDPEARNNRISVEIDKIKQQIDEDPRKYHEFRLDMFRRLLENWLYYNEEITNDLEIAMISFIVDTWSAFEIVAADLWEVALNESAQLAVVAINSDPREGEKSFQKSEVLRFIENAIKDGEDILPGTLLKRTQKFDFQSYDGVRYAYRSAFTVKATDELLDAQDFRDLDVLDSLRNCFVHRGGITDKRFRSRAAKNRVTFKDFDLDEIEEGQKLAIDGDVVKRLLDSTICAAVKLVHFVDGALLVPYTPKG